MADYSEFPNSPPSFPLGSPNYNSRRWTRSPSTPGFHDDFSSSLGGPPSGGQPSKLQSFQPLVREYEPSFHRSTRMPNRVALFLYNWWLCVISVITSILALLAIVIILAFVDDKTLPRLPFNITVNTYISFFSTIAKATMLFAVAECLSQLKWLWFRQPRMLEEIQTFDDASRGPLGAIKLILQTSAFHLATLGGLITILSLVMDPFAQQILSYRSRNAVVMSDSASTWRAQAYDEQVDLSSLDSGLLPGPDWGLKAAVFNGIFSPQTVQDLKPYCDTGNCTFPLFDSLAVCNKCLNVTNDVINNSPEPELSSFTGVQNLSYTLPGGAHINFSALFGEGNLAVGPSTVSTTVLPANLSLDVLGLRDPLLTLAVLQFPNVKEQISEGSYWSSLPVAHECAIYFCINTYNITVTNSIANTTVISSWTSDTGTPTVGGALQPGGMEGTQDAILQRPSTMQGVNNTYIIPAGTLATVKSWLNHTLQGTYNTSFSIYNGTAWPSDAFQALDGTSNWTYLISNVTTAMTAYVRSADNVASINILNGTSHRVETYIRVRWGWLGLPVGLAALSIIFLVGTIVKNERRRGMAWKSSSLALLFHGLEGVGRGAGEGLGQMKEVAKRTRVVLTRGDDGEWKLINTG